MRRRATVVVASAAVVALLAAGCCPVSVPPPTAFVAHLTPLGPGTARADLPDGRQLVVSGLDHLAAGDYYVTGSMRADGSVVADSVEPVRPPSAGGRTS